MVQITIICLKFFGAFALMAFNKYFFRNLTINWGYFPPMKMHLAYSMLIKHCWLHFSNKTIKRYYFRPCRTNENNCHFFLVDFICNFFIFFILLTVKCMRNKSAYFAERLYKSMKVNGLVVGVWMALRVLYVHLRMLIYIPHTK